MLRIEAVGQGPPLLYLHDWGFGSQVWTHQVDYFRARYRNCLVDYNLERLPENVGYDEVPAHLCEAIGARWEDTARAPRAIVASGFGACLAYELIERGWRPEALVLFGGLVRFTNGESYLSGLPGTRVAEMRQALQATPQLMLTAYYRSAFSGDGEEVPRELARAVPLNALGFLRLAFDTMISHDYRDLAAQLPVRTLLVQGEADAIVPIWQGQLLRRLLRRSELHLCAGAGHMPFFTRYAAINRRVARFLDAAAPDGGAGGSP